MKETQGVKKSKITRERIFDIIQIGNDKDKTSRAFDFIIVGLIIANVILSVCLTFEELKDWERLLHIIEAFTVMCFTVELGLRLWTADFIYKKKGDTLGNKKLSWGKRVVSAIKYLFSLNGIIEFLSIIPFYLPLFFPGGVVVFRMFRVVRILRLFQANTYSDAISTIIIVLRRKRSQIASSLVIIFIIMLMSSLLMYNFEHKVQPDIFRNAFSGIWWATSTLLTIGYGDIYPITLGGQIASIVIAFLGVGAVAIPTGILSAGFTEYISKDKGKKGSEKQEDVCPHCGKSIHI